MDQDLSGPRRLKAVDQLPADAQALPCLAGHEADRNARALPIDVIKRPAPHGRPHALIVDDNQCNRILLGHMVALAGGTSEQAADGLEALEKLSERAFDIVFMDIAMPRMDGIAATFEIRKRGIRVVVLAVTAHYDVRDSDELIALGFDGLIPKPIELTRILSWLLGWVEVNAGGVVAAPLARRAIGQPL